MSTTERRPRRYDLDNVRTFLTVLLVYHHTAIAYTGLGSWPFISRCFEGTSTPLALFTGFNQTFFMGLFFWLSGYFSGQGLAKNPSRDGRLRFVGSKCFRLGLPAVMSTLFIYPMSSVMVEYDKGAISLSISSVYSMYRDYWKTVDGVRGPVWYLATLLVFDIIAAGIAPTNLASVPRSIRWLCTRKYSVLLAWISVAMTNFVVRIYYPLLRSHIPIIGVLQGYLAQYVLAYILGHVAYLTSTPMLVTPFNQAEVYPEKPRSPLETSSDPLLGRPRPKRQSFPSSGLIFISIPVIIAVILYFSRPKYLTSGKIFEMLDKTGPNLISLHYCFVNEVLFAVIGSFLLRNFAQKYNKPLPRKHLLAARFSYAAFLIHAPVSTAIELWVDRQIGCGRAGPKVHSVGVEEDAAHWEILGPVIMTMLVGTVNFIASFLFGRAMVDYLPLVGRVI